MRITQSMMTRQTIQRVFINRDIMYQTHERISTGKKVNRPSDDATAYARIARYEKSYQRNLQYLSNVQYSRNWVNETSVALDKLQDYASQAKAIALKAVDASNDDDSRQVYARQLRGILEESVSTVNAKYLDKSLFAGTNTKNSTPFVLNDLTVTYTGNDEKIKRRLAEDMVSEINTTGQRVMDTGFFQAMETMITALEANDIPAIEDTIDDMQTAYDAVLNLSGEVGSFHNSLSLIENRLKDANMKLEEYLADDQDVVLEEEFVRLESEQTAYQAAMQSAAKIMRLNILNYM
ncbi:MAG TPA: hypothetical protein ENK44_05620 [Caldithrix abyssi]|uniref:Flagellin N-terminal domain-containing protein n=1 Tax=Caldithrix abyssi TaxID=187145 RepID=A0A7V4WVB0_CALAY|nr:hypothetical protein [Caldithrix abyssi]